MIAVVIAAAACAVVVAVGLVAWRRRVARRAPRSWSQLVRGWEVLVEAGPERLKIVLLGHGRLPAGIALHPTDTEVDLGVPRHTGDPSFDRLVIAAGDERQLLAVLSGPARESIRDAVAVGVRFTFGLLEIELPRRALRRLDDAVHALADLADLLAVQDDELARRLAANAVADPIERVRWRTLEILVTAYPADQATAAAILLARQDPSPEVQRILTRHVAEAIGA